MQDAFLCCLRRTLPDDLCGRLEARIQSLEHGDFQSFFEEPTVKAILGALEDPRIGSLHFEGDSDWNDWIFDRIGLILSNRTDDRSNESTQSSAFLQHLLFLTAYACLQAFLQSNVTGPPLPFSPAKLLLPENIVKDESLLRGIRSRLVLSLGVDGEAAYKLTPNVELLCLADTIITSPPISKNIPVSRWLRFRVHFVHQRLLSEVSPTLQRQITEDLAYVEDQLVPPNSKDDELRVSFLLERASIHLHHGLDKQAREDVAAATRRRKFVYALTGLPGRRTKYQEREISQLVVLARSADSGKSTTEPVTAEIHSNDVAIPKHMNLDDDTLLEKLSFSQPKLNDQHESDLPPSLKALDPSDQPRLQPLDSIILLALASSITNTSPADGLTREETLPYAVRVLEGGSSNWQIYTQALLVRSRIEGYKTRTTERGLLQLQALVDQVVADTTSSSDTGSSGDGLSSFLPRPAQSESAPASERLRFIYQLCSPTRWELEAELASRWVSLGGLRSALEVYERLELWAEAALCWAATDREDKAKTIVRRQLFHASSGEDENVDTDVEKWEGPARDPPPADAPRLYCILGDIDRDVAMYEKAWEVSGERYARAQRSLGRHYFSAHDFAKAALAYRKSLSVNQLNGASWFALGCALLELAQFERAVEAFSRTVQLDETDAEAWSNLATALLRLPPGTEEVVDTTNGHAEVADDDDEDFVAARPKRDPQKHKRDALKALKRAASLKYDNFRIWDNLLTVAASIVPPVYAEVVIAQKRVIEIRGPSVGEKSVDEDIMELLIQHVVSSDMEPDEPGLARMVTQLVDKQVVPLITSSRRLWQTVAKLALWRKRPGSALEAHEKAWRAVTSQPGWESGSETRWDEVVEATIDLVDAYQSLGPVERTEGLGAGEQVAKDWKFKARSAVRGVVGRGRDGWEGTAGWEKLKECLDGLRNA